MHKQTTIEMSELKKYVFKALTDLMGKSNRLKISIVSINKLLVTQNGVYADNDEIQRAILSLMLDDASRKFFTLEKLPSNDDEISPDEFNIIFKS